MDAIPISPLTNINSHTTPTTVKTPRDWTSCGQQRNRQAGHGPADAKCQDQEAHRRWQDGAVEHLGVPGKPARHQADQRREELVEQRRQQVEERQPKQDRHPFEHPHAADARARQEADKRPVAPPERDLFVELGDGAKRGLRKQPERGIIPARHALDDDLHIAGAAADRTDDFLVLFQRIGA